VLASADALAGSSGDRLPGSAKFSGNLAIQQQFPISNSLTGVVAASATYVGSRLSEFVNTSALPTPRFDLPSYTQIDLRAGITTNTNWRLDFYARNLTNKDGVVYATDRNGTSTLTYALIQPRTIGLTLAKSF
jgi:outer membrane receptor protein involved in Fe transport